MIRSAFVVLLVVFFLSGASALLFETLWFRLAGLVFGNSVWASALVLSAFMTGLALGNGLAAFSRFRLFRPVRLYALLELVIAAVGILLLFILPQLTAWFAPLFRGIGEHPVPLNALRFALALLLLAVPSTAMGLTLPVLVKALYARMAHFGVALGWLYGINTLGAVAGAIAGEAWLIECWPQPGLCWRRASWTYRGGLTRRRPCLPVSQLQRCQGRSFVF